MERSLPYALLARELKGSSAGSCAVHSCAEDCFLQHAVSHYCCVEGFQRSHVKSTIAAAFSPSHVHLVASSHGDHTIKVHHWRGGVLQVLHKGGHDRTPWTVAWHPTDPGLMLTGAIDGKVVLWDVRTGAPVQLVETGKTVASCCFHPAGDMALYCASNKVYMWPVSAEKPWPILPVRAYKSKHVMRMVMFNPGQPDMLLTGELVGREYTAAQLSPATPAATKAAMRRKRTEACTGSRCGRLCPAVQQRRRQQQQLDSLPTALQQQQLDSLPTALQQQHLDTLPTALQQQQLDSLPTALQQQQLDSLPTALQQQQQQPPTLSEKLTTAHRLIVEQQAEHNVHTRAGDAQQVPVSSVPETAVLSSSSSTHEIAVPPNQSAPGCCAAVVGAGANDLAVATSATALATQHIAHQLSMLRLDSSTQIAQQQQQQQRRRGWLSQQQSAWQLADVQMQRSNQQTAALTGQRQQQQQEILLHQGQVQQQEVQGQQQHILQHLQQQQSLHGPVTHSQPPLMPEQRSQQQPAEVVLGSSPTTTFFQNLGASFWLGSRRHATHAASMPTAAVEADAPEVATAAPAAALSLVQPDVPVCIDTLQLLLSALRQHVGYADDLAEGVVDHAGYGLLVACQQQQQQQQQAHGNLQRCASQQQGCACADVHELMTLLQCFQRLGMSLLQLPGFSSRWGLDASGLDAQLMWCDRPQRAASGMLAAAEPWPISLDCLMQMNTIREGLQQLGSRSSTDGASAVGYPAAVQSMAADLTSHADLNSSIASLQAIGSSDAVTHAMQQQQSGVPCLAVLRLWQLQNQQPSHRNCTVPQQLSREQQRLVLPFVVLCSERSVGISPCGRLLVAVVATLKSDLHGHGGGTTSTGQTHQQQQQQQDAELSQYDPTKLEFYQLLEYELRVISLESSTFGEVLAARSVVAAESLTCVQVSPTGEHVLLAYGRRSRQRSCLVPSTEGSLEVWHTVLQVLRMSDLVTVRQLISKDDEVNVAIWHPQPGQGICYGTKAGRTRHIVACGSSCSEHGGAPSTAASAAGEATSVLQQTLQ